MRRNIVFELVNSVYFFLEHCLIIGEDNGTNFRLLVIHRNKVYTDKRYDTFIRAGSAFINEYGWKSWDETVKPQWKAINLES